MLAAVPSPKKKTVPPEVLALIRSLRPTISGEAATIDGHFLSITGALTDRVHYTDAEGKEHRCGSHRETVACTSSEHPDKTFFKNRAHHCGRRGCAVCWPHTNWKKTADLIRRWEKLREETGIDQFRHAFASAPKDLTRDPWLKKKIDAGTYTEKDLATRKSYWVNRAFVSFTNTSTDERLKKVTVWREYRRLKAAKLKARKGKPLTRNMRERLLASAKAAANRARNELLEKAHAVSKRARARLRAGKYKRGDKTLVAYSETYHPFRRKKNSYKLPRAIWKEYGNALKGSDDFLRAINASEWIYSPHWHLVMVGWLLAEVQREAAAAGWVITIIDCKGGNEVRSTRTREINATELRNLNEYLLSHAAVVVTRETLEFEGGAIAPLSPAVMVASTPLKCSIYHAVRYAGGIAYNVVSLEKIEREPETCAHCEAELVRHLFLDALRGRAPPKAFGKGRTIETSLAPCVPIWILTQFVTLKPWESVAMCDAELLDRVTAVFEMKHPGASREEIIAAIGDEVAAALKCERVSARILADLDPEVEAPDWAAAA